MGTLSPDVMEADVKKEWGEWKMNHMQESDASNHFPQARGSGKTLGLRQFISQAAAVLANYLLPVKDETSVRA